MNEILLQAIIEKLGAIELSLLKDNKPINDEALQTLLKEVKSFKFQLEKLPLELEKITVLLKSTTSLKFKLDSPKKEYLKHTHHLHKGIWFAIALFIISFLFLYGWINCIYTKKTFEVNDIKYRFLKVNNHPSILKILFQTDSLYKLNKDSFTEHVIAKEKILEGQVEQFRLAGEKRKDSIKLSKQNR
jgi:hypothetical protein